MIFTPENAALVMNGRKTQIRMPLQGEDWWWLFDYTEDGVPKSDIRAVFRCSGRGSRYRPLYEVGKTYAVQPGRGKPAIGRIRITQIRRERLADINLNDVPAEGCGSLGAYANLWDSIYYGKRTGLRWEANPEVWALTFEVVV